MRGAGFILGWSADGFPFRPSAAGRRVNALSTPAAVGLTRTVVFLNKCTYHTQVKNSPKPERREATAREQGSALCPLRENQREPGRRFPPTRRAPSLAPRSDLGQEPPQATSQAGLSSHAPAAPARKGHEKHSEVLKGRMTRAPEGQGSGRPLLRELWPCAPPFHPPQGRNQFRASVACNPGTRAI